MHFAKILTDPFESINELYLFRKHQSTDFEALTLAKGPPGRTNANDNQEN